MHSKKTELNSTQLNWTGSFSSVQFSFPQWFEPATSCDGRRQSSQLVARFRPTTDIALTAQEYAPIVKNLRRPPISSRIVAGRRRFNTQRETELNGTVQLSSVQFSFYRASAYWYWYSKSVCPSVRPSVCPLRSGIRWKRLNISSQFFQHTVAQSF